MLIARTVLKEAARTFFGTLVASTGMAFFISALAFMKIAPGVGLGTLLRVFPFFFPTAMQFTVPIAALVAVVVTFGRMQTAGELTALSASGVNLVSLAGPLLACASIISVGLLVLIDQTTPHAGAQLRAASRDLGEQMQTAFRSGMRDIDLRRARISFEGYADGEFEDILLEIKEDPTHSRLVRARSGSLRITKDDQIRFDLDELHAMMPREPGRGHTFASVDLLSGQVDLDEAVLTSGGKRKRGDLFAWELAYVVDRGLPKEYNVRVKPHSASEEAGRRSALAASVFFFVLVGIPLGILSGKRTRVGAVIVGISPVLLVYFPLIIGGSNLARSGALPGYPALWFGNVVLAVAGAILLYRVARR
ncbi:MAG: LptF/LptG family permease [Planctomycetota bacterium]|jgi:lipopolysaccharide export system permease protein